MPFIPERYETSINNPVSLNQTPPHNTVAIGYSFMLVFLLLRSSKTTCEWKARVFYARAVAYCLIGCEVHGKPTKALFHCTEHAKH